MFHNTLIITIWTVLQFWKDEFLVWDPVKFDGVTELFLPPSKIWIPELAIYYR